MMIRNSFSGSLSRIDKKNVIYIAYIGKYNNADTYKYGKSYDLYQRVHGSHRTAFDVFDIRHVYQTNHKDHVETLLEKNLKFINLHEELFINKKKQTELFQPRGIYTIDYVNDLVLDIIDEVESTDVARVKLEMEKLKLEKMKLRRDMKEIDYKMYCIKNKFITK